MPNELWVIVGWNKKIIVIEIMTKLRLNSPIFSLKMLCNMSKPMTIMIISIKGSSPIKSSLNIGFEGVNHFISVSLANQSIDKKVFPAPPTLSAGMNISLKALGKFRLYDIESVIICK